MVFTYITITIFYITTMLLGNIAFRDWTWISLACSLSIFKTSLSNFAFWIWPFEFRPSKIVFRILYYEFTFLIFASRLLSFRFYLTSLFFELRIWPLNLVLAILIYNRYYNIHLSHYVGNNFWIHRHVINKTIFILGVSTSLSIKVVEYWY